MHRAVLAVVVAIAAPTTFGYTISVPLQRPLQRPLRCAPLLQQPSLRMTAASTEDVEVLDVAEEAPPPPFPPPLLVLLLVPLAWGTYGPAVKTLYTLDAPPPELAFNWLNYIVSSSALATISFARTAMSPAAPELSADTTVAAKPAEDGVATDADADAVADANRAAILAGLELGGYLFLGSTVQIFGMRYTSAGRAAFIVQLTTVVVPLLDALVNRRLPDKTVLAGCFLAFLGVSVLLTDGGSGAAASGGSGADLLSSLADPGALLSSLLSTSTGLGDGLVGLSALVYSLHVVRLSYHAPRLNPIVLARAKEASRLIYSSAVLAVGVAVSSDQAGALSAFARSFSEHPEAAAVAMGIVVWNGLVTTAFPTWAQSYGQAAVDAGTAQVMYTSQPLWSALFGFLVLGETFSEQGVVGAGLMLAAVVLVASTSAGREAETVAPADAQADDDGGGGGGGVAKIG